MKFGSDNNKEMDLENLDSIIKRCEEAMGKSFKKAPPEGSPAEEASESPEEEKQEGDGHDDADLNDLLELYSKIKGK
jgi:hypothetical protein